MRPTPERQKAMSITLKSLVLGVVIGGATLFSSSAFAGDRYVCSSGPRYGHCGSGRIGVSINIGGYSNRCGPVYTPPVVCTPPVYTPPVDCQPPVYQPPVICQPQ